MVKLAILWHMHQPFYEDLATGEHILPWVRLHAIKDYLGMVRLLEEFPRVRVTFNLVPSLLVQVQAFAENRAQDRHLAIGLKPASELDPDERAFLVSNGFHAPDRMIRAYPRYGQLLDQRHAQTPFSIDDLRDLQVLHKLAWIDPDRLRTDRRLEALVRRGQRFSEEDKQTLRAIELELLAEVIPAYAAAAARGQVELSTSPFYHPILPLLCDTDAHLRAFPHSVIPRGLFKWPADANEQITRAVQLHTELFGTPPRGVWPSEGAVSDAAVDLLAQAGAHWIATDEGILSRSLGKDITGDLLYRPYEVGAGEKTVRCLFRDHGLSDLIGFSYQSWDAELAAADFVRRVEEAGRRFTAAGATPVVSVILDGENAWEHYEGGGRPFLRALYARLESAPEIATVTMSEAADEPATRLASLFPGSWINSDFYIWAGHPDDHRAWRQLAAARRAFDQPGSRLTTEARTRAFEELLIAEGSDWFWWYGDDHSSNHDQDFDELFRRHLRNVYRALDVPVPDELWVTNITTSVAAGPVRPRTLVSPVIDGEVTGFAEWVGATSVALGVGGGTMHRVASELVRELLVGVDTSKVAIRISGPALLKGLRTGEYGLALVIGTGAPRRLDLRPGQTPGAEVAFGSVAEVSLDRSMLVGTDHRVSFRMLVTNGAGHVIEQHPTGAAIDVELPGSDLDSINWTV